MLAVAKQKYPAATGNQLIQSLIHNTTESDHALVRDTTGGYGYGPASLRHLLAVDPSQYPDENPLMDKAYGKPTVEQVAEASAPHPGSSSSSPAAVPGEATGHGGGGGMVTLLVVLAVVGLVVLAGLVVLLVALPRRGPTRRESGS
jgi:hypothetical protein